jgi:uroporphyrinogen III methyltransferase/synthase
MKTSVILVVRKFDGFSALLIENGFDVINLPLVETIPAEDLSELDKKLSKIESYDGIFFTSKKAAEVFLDRFNQEGKHFRGKIFAFGESVKQMLEAAGFETVFVKEANTALEFINRLAISDLKDKRLLFLKGDKSLRIIPETLKGIAEVNEVIVYQNVKPKVDERLVSEIKAKFRRKKISFACFFSPSGIENFLGIFGKELLKEIKIGAIGQTTAGKVRESGLAASFISARATAEDFARGLIKHICESEVEINKKPSPK